MVEPVRISNPHNSNIARDGGLIRLSNGTSLHVEVTGNQDGDAIVFIHGLGGNLNLFKPAVQATKLDHTHKLVFFDWRGHGLSPLQSKA